MNKSQFSLEKIFETHLQTLALPLQPGTVANYRYVARRFLSYLRTTFPKLHRLSQLRRDPHLQGWFRQLCEQKPPLNNATRTDYLIRLRRLLADLAANGHRIAPDLIRPEDFPPPSRYHPKPLSPPEDQRLQQELRRMDDLAANALLLTRATGIRIGECINLPPDCLRQVGPDQWALHVPLGKMHNERLVPVDPEVRGIVARILSLRASASPVLLAKCEGLLPPRRSSRRALYSHLRSALGRAAQRTHCAGQVTPHRMRHSFATEMLRLGVSLPALMQLLGHKDIRMTLRYVEVTQQDLQREYHKARQNAAQRHRLPTLSVPPSTIHADLSGIGQTLAATRHLLEMYRRQLRDEKAKRKLQRLDKRLLAVASQLKHIAAGKK
jgi:site-specific recombinase XerD